MGVMEEMKEEQHVQTAKGVHELLAVLLGA
jgi:hypothetical protein